MGFWKVVLLWFLSSLLLISVFTLGILWSLHIFLYPQVYEKALNDSGAYALINTSVGPLENFIDMPSGGTTQLVNNLLGNALSYARGESGSPNITVGVNITDLDFFLAAESMFKSSCSPGENPFSGGIQPSCGLSNISADYINLELESAGLLSGTNQINILALAGINSTIITGIRSYVMDYEYALYGFFALTLILIISIFFLSDSRTRWSGVYLILGGGAVFLSGYITSKVISSGLNSGTVQIVARDLMGSLLSRMGEYAFVAAGLGIVFIIFSFVLKKEKSLAPAATAKPGIRK